MIFGQNSKKSDIVIRERERINSSLGDQQGNRVQDFSE